ncbi:hypothetical protein ACFWEJ_07445 [Promicromonospora sp. NPDC060204]|uniref:hypothetical protein n=1 Tax=Promicromonospora sp. NPDC060204 TaxID=3347071 RepID=UPI00365ADF72
MNRHDDAKDQDHGWVDPAGSGLLAQTLGAMADGVDPASPTGPAAAIPAMSRRVRLRRGAKLGGLGGGALALAAVVALGATQLAPPDDGEVLPGSPASGSPTSAPAFQVRDGYQPPWLEWSDLTCGMPVADLETTAQGWSVTPAGDIYTRTDDLDDERSRSWGMATAFQDGKGTLDVAPVLVWSQDGVVLDLGPNVFDEWTGQDELPVPLVGTGASSVAALGTSMSTCVPGREYGDLQHKTPLPEGDYEVRVVAFPRIDGQWATTVSDPVQVRLDADGAHSPGEPRAAEPAVEFPDPVEGQVSRFELDRTTDLVTAEMTQLDYSSDTPMRVMGGCASSDPEDLLPIELVLPSTGEVIAASQITCDGYEAGSAVGALSENRSGETIDIRLPDVPDGVSRLWVSLEPETPVAGDTGPECSATGYDPVFQGEGPSREAATATAGDIMVAALECDVDGLVDLANASGTELMPDDETPEQTFALPESGVQHYRTLVTLLASTSRAYGTGPDGNETIVQPRVATEEFADSDEAWDEVVAVGLLTAEEAAAQRADGTYLGPRIGIAAADGTWRYYVAGQ